MSGIVGLYYPDGRAVDRADVERMVESIAHRGPDGLGVWSEGGVGLGHRMLWTTPESLRERLPLVDQGCDLAITADARIDNRDELVAALGLDSGPREELSDSELILRAYEHWGERCPERLLGDFAFVVWDGRRQVLFCARDHFGVRPFYYYRSPHLFAFASEIKALLRLREVPRRLNETRVADYLVPILEDKAITFYQDISRLPSAHILIVGSQGIHLQPYWALDPSRELRLGSDEEYAEALRELFTKAVRCRLRSAFPVGSMLSGGLDSSSIVCVARELLSQDGKSRLHTFSAVFDDAPDCDERPFINAVLAQGGLHPHYVRADRLIPLADIDRVFWHQDEAFFGPNLFMHLALFRTAREEGVRVVLDGFDGDTTVSHGVAYLSELAHTRRWSALAAEVIGLAKNFNVSPWRILWHRVLRPLTPQRLRTVWGLLRGGRRPPWDTIINPDFARRVNLRDRLNTLRGDLFEPARTSKEDHWRRLADGLTQYSVEVADAASMMFLVRPRFPFFDKRLAEFCLALPAEQKLSHGWTRLVMRRAMANILPKMIQWRAGKSDFSPVLTRGLLAFNRGLVEEVILNDVKVIEEYVDPSTLRGRYQRYACRGAQEDAITIWKAVVLALWLRGTGLSPTR